jgi:hypothetical protein
VFTPEELRFLHEHIGDLEKYTNRKLKAGSVSSAWIAGYFRIESTPAHRPLFLWLGGPGPRKGIYLPTRRAIPASPGVHCGYRSNHRKVIA